MQRLRLLLRLSLAAAAAAVICGLVPATQSRAAGTNPCGGGVRVSTATSIECDYAAGSTGFFTVPLGITGLRIDARGGAGKPGKPGKSYAPLSCAPLATSKGADGGAAEDALGGVPVDAPGAPLEQNAVRGGDALQVWVDTGPYAHGAGGKGQTSTFSCNGIPVTDFSGDGGSGGGGAALLDVSVQVPDKPLSIVVPGAGGGGGGGAGGADGGKGGSNTIGPMVTNGSSPKPEVQGAPVAAGGLTPGCSIIGQVWFTYGCPGGDGTGFAVVLAGGGGGGAGVKGGGSGGRGLSGSADAGAGGGAGSALIPDFAGEASGNTSNPAFLSFSWDVSPPTTSPIALSPSSPDGKNGWYTSVPTISAVTATADPAGPGLSTVHCSLDPASVPTLPSQITGGCSPVALSYVKDGMHAVYAVSTDFDGRSSAIVSKTWKVDTTAPDAQLAFFGLNQNPDGSYPMDVSVSLFFCGDSGSGVDPATPCTQFQVLHYADDTSASSTAITVADLAGNQSTTGTVMVRFEKPTPDDIHLAGNCGDATCQNYLTTYAGGAVSLRGYVDAPANDGGSLTIDWGDGSTTTASYPCVAPDDPSCPFSSTPSFDTSGTGIFFHFDHTYANAPASGTTFPITVSGTEPSSGTAQATASTAATVLTLSPDGSGSAALLPGAVSAGQSGRVVATTYTADSGAMVNGTLTEQVPAGWSAPSVTATDPGYTTASVGTVSVSGQTITISGLLRTAGQTVVVTYGSKAGGGPGATAPSTPVLQAWSVQERSNTAGTLTLLASSPALQVTAADGSGSAALAPAAVSAGASGRVVSLTYTTATGGIASGTLTEQVPSGWSAPSLTPTDPGYTVASLGTVSVSGQIITISGLTRTTGQTVIVTYGSKAGGGPAATAPSTPALQTWQMQEQSSAAGTLTSLASSLQLQVTAADGSGSAALAPATASARQSGRVITTTYTAASGGMLDGTLMERVPTGWNAPSLAPTDAGYTTASLGTVSVSGQIIIVSGLTRTSGQTVVVTYGSKAGGGPGATAPSTPAVQAWPVWERSTAAGTLTPLASPTLQVASADGSGFAGLTPGAVSAGASGRVVTMTYTAATGGIASGTLTEQVPLGWSAPSSTATDPGYTTASLGTVSVSGQTIFVSGLTRTAGQTVVVTYGSKAGGGPGATAPSTPAVQTWPVRERSTVAGSLTYLASSPKLQVTAADGSGLGGLSPSAVSAGASGRVVFLTYTTATGGMASGTLTEQVPLGWSAPSLTPTDPGYTTASLGTVSVSGQTIIVSGLTRTTAQTVLVTYGSKAGGGPGATAPSTPALQTWPVRERSTPAGTLTYLASSPKLQVTAADGSGLAGLTPGAVSAGASGRVVSMTYTAATGGIASGTLTEQVPLGWSAPSLTPTAPGYTTASLGTVSVSGQTIIVSGLTRASGQTVVVTYGSKAGGGPGATAPSTPAVQTWPVRERSTAAGTLTYLASSPKLQVTAADGSGTLTTPTASILHQSTGTTIVFTYTAATGGLVNGALRLVVPYGWSAPSLTATGAAYTIASLGTVSVSGQTITISGLTRATAQKVFVTYGSKAGGGPGATAPASAVGAQTWRTSERSSATGTLTALASSPSITVR